MEKNNGKIIAIVALVVAVVALSVGFAAFADQLTIDGQATAQGSENPFDDTTNGALEYDNTANATKCYYGNDTSDTTTVHGTASGDSWSGISVSLTREKPSVTCTATVKNDTTYNAYLRGIKASGPVTCASNGTNAATNASSVCATVAVTAQFGAAASDKITINKDTAANYEITSGLSGSVSANGTSTVTVVISYDPTNSSADEDVTITLPTITHTYSSAQTGDIGSVAG